MPMPVSRRSAGGRRRSRTLPAIIGALTVLALAVGVFVFDNGFARTDGGEVAVIRNGGPFDNQLIRGDPLRPGSARTWVGLFSTKHSYFSSARFYTITSDVKRGDRSGFDVENLPTSDGVAVGIEGIVYFTLNQDAAVLKEFDNRFGTRSYRAVNGQYFFPWQDGNNGWSVFLDNVVRPEISNALREQIGSVRCVDLQAACVLVQNGTAAAAAADPSKVKALLPAGNGGKVNNQTISKVQDEVNKTLQANLNATLGGPYFQDIKFNLVKTTLPSDLQQAITDVQSAFARVSESQARVASATADAQANKERQRGYQSCPACAQIDTLKAIPPSVTTFAPGAGFAITSK